MLTVHIICIGKLKENYLKSACEEYQKRLQAFCKLHIVELNEYKLPGNPSEAQIEKAIQMEGEGIAVQIKSASSYCITLCIEGSMMSSEKLASQINTVALNGTSELYFIIGGSFGLSQMIKQRSDWQLSMSPMTFPHQLARVMLLEQIYRAFQINGNGKYHK